MDVISEIKYYYEELNSKFGEFLNKLKEEGVETQEAFKLLKGNVFNGDKLTPEQKEKIGNQLKDVFKTIGLVGIVTLPGGSLFLIVSSFLKINKYVLPSSFNESEKKDGDSLVKGEKK